MALPCFTARQAVALTILRLSRPPEFNTPLTKP
jgi:hypothetical protein